MKFGIVRGLANWYLFP